MGLRKLLVVTSIVITSMGLFAQDVVDYYKLNLSLQVPVIVDNMQSKGKRVYKTQSLVGTLLIIYKDGYYPIIRVKDLYNKSYKISGKYVTYKTYVEDEETKCNYIGDNKKNVFKIPTVMFKIEADPSYNVGDDEPDNTLILTLAGTGTSKDIKGCKIEDVDPRYIRTLRGYAAGQLGCGCSAYGHVSPTRVASKDGAMLDQVEDIAACWGQWNASFQQCIVYKEFKVDED